MSKFLVLIATAFLLAGCTVYGTTTSYDCGYPYYSNVCPYTYGPVYPVFIGRPYVFGPRHLIR
jgi:hypothetical protein